MATDPATIPVAGVMEVAMDARSMLHTTVKNPILILGAIFAVVLISGFFNYPRPSALLRMELQNFEADVDRLQECLDLPIPVCACRDDATSVIIAGERFIGMAESEDDATVPDSIFNLIEIATTAREGC